MNKFQWMFVAIAAGASIASPVAAHERVAIAVTKVNSERLIIHRARASLHHGEVKVHGWVKPPRYSRKPVSGRLRVEALAGDHCVLVHNARWSRITRRWNGHFSVTLPQMSEVSEVRLSHVDRKTPPTCTHA